MKRIFTILLLVVFLYSVTEAQSIESLPVNGGGYITNIAVSPSSPNIVYAASDLGAMYRSTDYGDNWEIKIKGLITNADFGVTTIGIDPQDPDVVYIGTGHIWNTEPGAHEGGIFKTTNGGDEWVLSTRKAKFSAMGAFDVQGRMIAVDPTNSNIVYAGSHQDGIFKSTDAGASWSYEGLNNKYISSVVIDPTDTDIIYVSVQDVSSRIPGASGHGIYKSTDAGNTWSTLTTSYDVYDLTIDAQNNQILYTAAYNQGLYKSIDGGSSWSEKTPSGTSGYEFVSVSCSPTNPSVVYAKTRDVNKIYRTSDGGDTWSSTSSLHTDGWYFGSSAFGKSSSGLTVDPTNADRCYSGTWFSVWRTDDAGSNWTVKPKGLETSAAFECSVNPDAPNELYECHADIGLFKSTNSGTTWTRIPQVGGNCWTTAIDNSTNPVTVYAGTGNWSGSTTNGKIFKSTDNGSSWSAITSGLSDSRVRSISIDPTDPNIVYAGQSSGNVYKSTDKGSSWTSKSSGLGSSEVLTIAINPSSPDIVYTALKYDGIYKSTNGGDSWSSSDSGIGTSQTYDIALDPNDPDIVYIAARNDGIYRSTDAGGSWTRVLSHYGGRAVAVDDNSVVYAGGKSYFSAPDYVPGLYRSTDGITWGRIDDGLLSQGIENITIDPTNSNRLYISTQGNGTFSVDVDSGPDTTPPIIYSISSSVTSESATISWKTYESSDSQVEYGTTTSYGSSTTLNASMVTSHSQSLTGLSASTLYHYRVKSRDAAGNPAVSEDNTFTTLDPSVLTSITVAPLAAAINKIGDNQTFVTTCKDQYENTMTGVTISWTSSNTSVATVDSSGTATGVSDGSSIITATSGSISGTADLTVDESALDTITSRVSQTSDDAEEYHLDNGWMNLGSSDLDMCFETANEVDYQMMMGIRFQDIQVPQGAAIISASIEFETDETGSSATSLIFHGEDTDSSSTFTTTAYNISTREKTSAAVEWNSIPAWNTVDEKHQTPDIASIIQEIVDRSGWSSGNALSIIITGTGVRTAESYDGEADNAPLLTVEYTDSSTVSSKPYEFGDNIVIYPNPSNGEFNIQVSEAFNLDIIDITGKLVKQQVLNSNVNTVNISRSGTYFLRFTNAKTSYTQKIIINK